ncbi:hypothetical protein HNV12_03830 [Methanococcoides sp. SA1]|nr:hypothetical protein [Methanococcoides sp. SA1]
MGELYDLQIRGEDGGNVAIVSMGIEYPDKEYMNKIKQENILASGDIYYAGSLIWRNNPTSRPIISKENIATGGEQ